MRALWRWMAAGKQQDGGWGQLVEQHLLSVGALSDRTLEPLGGPLRRVCKLLLEKGWETERNGGKGRPQVGICWAFFKKKKGRWCCLWQDRGRKYKGRNRHYLHIIKLDGLESLCCRTNIERFSESNGHVQMHRWLALYRPKHMFNSLRFLYFVSKLVLCWKSKLTGLLWP